MAVENISDQNGRALEYKIVEQICRVGFQIDEATARDQKRDMEKYNALNDILKGRYEKAAIKVEEWLDNEFSIRLSKLKKLKRLKDNESKKGNVSDISIQLDNNEINLSIKHNHSAIKHQRPSALPLQLGYTKDSKACIEYKRLYLEITRDFLKQAHEFMPNAVLFSELKNQDPEYIHKHFYNPVCKLVSDFLNTYGQCEYSKNFFNFLVGNVNFYKLITYPNQLKISQYADIGKPDSILAHVVGDSYVIVKFSNDWEVSMRLHTASSKLTSLSLKFDTQPQKIEVPETVIKL